MKNTSHSYMPNRNKTKSFQFSGWVTGGNLVRDSGAGSKKKELIQSNSAVVVKGGSPMDSKLTPKGVLSTGPTLSGQLVPSLILLFSWTVT